MCQYFQMSGIIHDDAAKRYVGDTSCEPSPKVLAPIFMTKLNSVSGRNTQKSFENAHLRPIEFWIEAGMNMSLKSIFHVTLLMRQPQYVKEEDCLKQLACRIVMPKKSSVLSMQGISMEYRLLSIR